MPNNFQWNIWRFSWLQLIFPFSVVGTHLTSQQPPSASLLTPPSDYTLFRRCLRIFLIFNGHIVQLFSLKIKRKVFSMHGFIIKLHGINWKKTCGESENHTQEEWDFFSIFANNELTELKLVSTKLCSCFNWQDSLILYLFLQYNFFYRSFLVFLVFLILLSILFWRCFVGGSFHLDSFKFYVGRIETGSIQV